MKNILCCTGDCALWRGEGRPRRSTPRDEDRLYLWEGIAEGEKRYERTIDSLEERAEADDQERKRGDRMR